MPPITPRPYESVGYMLPQICDESAVMKPVTDFPANPLSVRECGEVFTVSGHASIITCRALHRRTNPMRPPTASLPRNQLGTLLLWIWVHADDRRVIVLIAVRSRGWPLSSAPQFPAYAIQGHLL
jgi:hypothetical protein